MPDAFSPSLRIQLMQTGGDPDTWGVIANTQFLKFEDAITGDNGYAGGTGGISLTGQASPLALTVNNGTADQASQLLYPFVGTLTADFTVLLPGVPKIGWVVNATTGGHNVILKVGAGTTLTVPSGGNWTFFYCDGANVIAPTISFGSGVGPITVNGNATINGAVTVQNGITAGGAISGAGISSTSGFTSSALDDASAGGQFRATFGGYGALLRNDGSNVYLLQTATGDQNGTFNAFRPFSWSLTNGAVTIDGTGAGVTLGGSVTIAGTTTATRFQVAGTGGQFAMSNNGANQLLNFAANQFLQFVPGDGFTLNTTGGNIHLLGALTNNGFPVAKGDGGIYAINITGAANSAGAVAWANVSGKPFAFNQSTDINASPTFTSIQANGAINVSGANSESSTGMVLEPTNVTAAPIAWNFPISVNCAQSVAAINFATVSDQRMKEDIHDIGPEEGVRWVKLGRPRHFTMGGRPMAGFIAQEDVETGRGEAISQVKDEDPRFAAGDGYSAPGKRLLRDYNQDSAYLTAALKVALDRIEKLEARITDLEDNAD